MRVLVPISGDPQAEVAGMAGQVVVGGFGLGIVVAQNPEHLPPLPYRRRQDVCQRRWAIAVTHQDQGARWQTEAGSAGLG